MLTNVASPLGGYGEEGSAGPLLLGIFGAAAAIKRKLQWQLWSGRALEEGGGIIHTYIYIPIHSTIYLRRVSVVLAFE